MYVANKHKKDGSESVTAFKAALHPAVKINATSNTTEPGSSSFLPSDKTSESSHSRTTNVICLKLLFPLPEIMS